MPCGLPQRRPAYGDPGAMLGSRVRRPAGVVTGHDAVRSEASNPRIPLETNMKLSSWIGVAAMAADATLASTPAAAQFAKAEDAVKHRQSAVTPPGSQFSRVEALAKSEGPD